MIPCIEVSKCQLLNGEIVLVMRLKITGFFKDLDFDYQQYTYHEKFAVCISEFITEKWGGIIPFC